MEGESGSKKTTAKGYIPEEVQQQAKKIESPVVNELLIAAKKGSTQQALEALARGGGADIVDRHGRNCLHLACLHGHYNTVLAILQSRQININSTNKRGLTALHDACTEGHTKVALLLLSMGSPITATTNDGWTPLMCACSNGHMQLAKILLAAGCQIDTVTSIGLTALHIAAWKGQSGVVEMLIHRGCTFQSESKNGKTALDLAQEESQQQCVMLLEAAVSEQSESPELRIAALQGQLETSQEKLTTAHQELEQRREAFSSLKKEKEEELAKAKEKLKRLNEKVSELQVLLKRSINSPPGTTVDPSTPKTKKPGKKDVFSETVPKSSSYNDLMSIETGDSPKKAKTKKLSPEIQHTAREQREKRNSVEKRSITDLVAESLKNPSTMAAIRQEIKSDNLTPKIQRKIKSNSIPNTTLPSLNGAPPVASPESPLLKKSSSPKNSPTSRPRWTKPSLKDSAI